MVRFAGFEDAEAIAHIHVESWRCAYRGIVPDSYLQALSVERKTVRWMEILSTENRQTLVSIDTAGERTGWVSFGACRDPGCGEQGEIYAIYLLPERRGQSFGAELMAEAEEMLRGQGFKTVFVWVLEQNLKARRFYERSGYHSSGIEKTQTFDGVVLTECRYQKVL